MIRNLLLSGAAAAALLALQPAQAETLSQALEHALRTSPEIETQREALRGLDENVAQARAGMRPNINAAAETGISFTESSEAAKPRDGGRTYPSSLSLTASQALFDGFQTDNAVDSAISAVRAGRFQLFQTEQSVILNAVSAYANVIQAQQNVRLAQNNVSVISKSLQAARDRFDVGEVTRTDVAQAEAQLAESRSNLVSQQGALLQARQTYERFVGVAPAELEKMPTPPELPQTLEEARQIAERRHPSILAARANVEAAAFGVKQAKGALLPQVDLTGSVTTGSDTAGRGSGVAVAAGAVEVTMPIYQGGVLQSQVRQAQALEDQRYHQLRDVTRQVLEQVGIAWENLETARATSVSNRARIRAEQIAFDGVSEEAKVGSRTTLDVLDAEQDLLDARVALVGSETSEQIAAYSLLSAIGLLSIKTLDLDVPTYDPEGAYLASQAFDAGYGDEEDAENEAWRANWAQPQQ